MDDEGRNPIDFGSRGHRSRSTLPPPPARGCHALRCLVFVFFSLDLLYKYDRIIVLSGFCVGFLIELSYSNDVLNST